VEKSPVLKVAINVPLSREFDYLPIAGETVPAPGCRVTVPFGRRRQTGLVLSLAADSAVPASKLRRAATVLDESPLLSDDDLWLLRFTGDYYHHPIGEVMAAALPALLRQGRELYPALVHVAATDAGAAADLDALARRAPRQAELLRVLLDAGTSGLEADLLAEQLPNWRRVARPLAARGLISEHTTRHSDDSPAPGPDAEPGPELNSDQRKAVDVIAEHAGFGAFVLDGVTGSGKTEVYLQLLRRVLDAGRQALILVPEIGLTPQLVARLRARLGIEPVTLHSALTDLERLTAWRGARSGEAALVVGTRSAVFTPLPRLGLIVVDEEHDHSLKQQEGLRYSARDLAIARAKRGDVPVVLGSATPSLELLHRCRTGQYRHLTLPQRAGGALPPVLRLVDLNRMPAVDGISAPLADAAAAHLDEGGQVLIFLNRRGYAPTLICTACGHVAECPRCDARMTVHAGRARLRCHHCGASSALPSSCPECGAAVRQLGEGTQRLEEALESRFPASRVTRIDSDSIQGKAAIDAALSLAEKGETEILVGTQMLSKGHHFPRLTLVGIVNADQGLFGSDFRSSERLAQSIVQVAGRAGRENRRGEVLIQTAFPDNPFWRRLIEGGYPAVAGDALHEREAARWPPFTRLALLRAAAHRHGDAHAFLDAARREIERRRPGSLRVLGPVDAPMARRAGRYHAQLLLQASDRGALHAALAALRPAMEEHPAARKVRWSIDVDPIELF